jgi:soluble lytic murein transglycosylase
MPRVVARADPWNSGAPLHRSLPVPPSRYPPPVSTFRPFLRVAPAAAFVAFAACALETGSCGGGHTVGPPQPPASPTTTTTVATTVATSTSAPPTPQGPPPAFDPSGVNALVAHPALLEVSRAIVRKDPRAAADALLAALDKKALAGDDEARGRFLLGRLRVQAKDDDAAAAAYALVPATSPLHPYATVRSAAIAAKKGNADEALALLAKVAEGTPLDTDLRMALGDAKAAKGDHEGAAKAYDGARKSPRWVDASIRYAEEVAAMGASGASLALDAAKSARRVRFEVPASSLVPRAEEAETKCKALLSPKDAATLGPPTPGELTTSAIAYIDASKSKEAEPILEKALASLKKQKGKEPWCRAMLALARVHERTKQKPKAGDEYGEAAAACTDEASRTAALYDGAKVVAGKQPQVARARFAELEKSFPKNRLADDARLRSALILAESGDPADIAKSEAMLSSLPDDYPEGDMRTEALFRLALPRLKSGEWAAAIPYLEKSLAIAPREDGYFVAGRVAYFLGRAELETGKVDAGVARLTKVVLEEPLSFAAAMSYARLSARSPESAKAIRDAMMVAMAAEPAGLLFGDRPEVSTDAFRRAVELARVGETDAARKELAAAGLLKDAAADPEGQWIAASLFAHAGDARAAHAIPRGKVTEWQRHFPSGKWRAAWEIAYPRPWTEIVEAAASKNEIPTAIVWGVMREESAFDPEAVSPSAAYGLLQLILPTAAAYAKPLGLASDAKSLTQPEINIPLGASFLRKLRKEFDKNPALAVPSYNAGEGATRKWMNPPLADSFDLWTESIPYDETRKYTKRVLTSFYAYVALYDAAHLDDELRASAGR